MKISLPPLPAGATLWFIWTAVALFMLGCVTIVVQWSWNEFLCTFGVHSLTFWAALGLEGLIAFLLGVIWLIVASLKEGR